MGEVRRVLLVVNRGSRQGDSDLAAIVARLRAGAVEPVTFLSDTPGHLADAVRGHCAGVDAVVVGGGDGTLHGVLPALLACGVPLGILPLGTANDAARSLGIPNDPLAACAAITAGHVARVDLGAANGVPFLNAANIGLGVAVTAELDPAEKRRWGVLGYVRAAARTWRGHRPFAAEVDCDGHRQRLHTIQLAIGNGRHYGGGMTVATDAVITDSLLHLYSVAPVGLLRLLRLLRLGLALRLGRHEQLPEVQVLAGRRIRVTTRRPFAVISDGEPTTRTPVLFEVLPRALPVYVPADSPAAREGHDAA